MTPRRSLSRRELMVVAGGAALLPACAPGFQLPASATFDELLERVHGTDPEIHNGLTNHAPMAAEALVTLELADRAVPFVNEHSKTLDPMQPGKVLGADEHDGALGVNARRFDWIATWSTGVETTAPAALLQREWPNLCAGYLADLCHGPIRTAHALRSLAREDTSRRRVEFAHALGAWSAYEFPLAGKPGAHAVAGRDLVQVLESIPVIPKAQRKSGAIDAMCAPLAASQDFIDAVESVDLSVWDPSRTITELTAAAARAFIVEPNIFLLHAVTGASAARLLLPALDVTQHTSLLACAFHSVASILAISQTQAGLPAPAASTTSLDAQKARAATSFDGHVIKLTEVAFRESAIDPRPEFVIAASVWRK